MSKRFAILLCAVAIPALASSAYAQSTDDTTAADAPTVSEDGLPDVIVTARRRAENAQKVPAAMSVVGGDLID